MRSDLPGIEAGETRALATPVVTWSTGKVTPIDLSAAHAPDLTRRTVSACASGARTIPRTVLLACEGWVVERGDHA